MKLEFRPIEKAKLDMKTGNVSGVSEKPKPADIGMPTPEFHRQVIDLVKKKTPIEKIHEAIDKHPDIKEKPRAKRMASAVNLILAKKI